MSQHAVSDASAAPALLDLARDIAVRAAEFALAARREGVSVAATKSTPTDIVTAVDRDTEALIRSLILSPGPTTASSARRRRRASAPAASTGSSTPSTAP